MGKWARLCLEYYVEEVNLVGQELVFWHKLAREDRPSEMTHEFNAANSQGISVLGSTLGLRDIYNKSTMGIQSGLLQDLVVAYNKEVTVHVENGGAVDFVLCIIASKWGLRRTPAIWRRWS